MSNLKINGVEITKNTAFNFVKGSLYGAGNSFKIVNWSKENNFRSCAVCTFNDIKKAFGDSVRIKRGCHGLKIGAFSESKELITDKNNKPVLDKNGNPTYTTKKHFKPFVVFNIDQLTTKDEEENGKLLDNALNGVNIINDPILIAEPVTEHNIEPLEAVETVEAVEVDNNIIDDVAAAGNNMPVSSNITLEMLERVLNSAHWHNALSFVQQHKSGLPKAINELINELQGLRALQDSRLITLIKLYDGKQFNITMINALNQSLNDVQLDISTSKAYRWSKSERIFTINAGAYINPCNYTCYRLRIIFDVTGQKKFDYSKFFNDYQIELNRRLERCYNFVRDVLNYEALKTEYDKKLNDFENYLKDLEEKTSYTFRDRANMEADLRRNERYF